jgi:hypothetical protein
MRIRLSDFLRGPGRGDTSPSMAIYEEQHHVAGVDVAAHDLAERVDRLAPDELRHAPLAAIIALIRPPREKTIRRCELVILPHHRGPRLATNALELFMASHLR